MTGTPVRYQRDLLEAVVEPERLNLIHQAQVRAAQD